MDMVQVATALPAEPVSIVQSVGYILGAIAVAISAWFGWKAKKKEGSEPTVDIAAQVAAALVERESREAIRGLTDALKRSNRLQDEANETQRRLIDRLDTLIHRLESNPRN